MTSNILSYPDGGVLGADGESSLDLALVAEMVEALQHLGGEAHRDLVIHRIKLNRLQNGCSDLSASEIYAAFDHHYARFAASEIQTPFLKPAFGPGSHRWRLDREALDGRARAT